MAPGNLGRRGTPLDWFHQLALRNAEPCAASAAAEPDLSNDVQRAFLAKGRGVSLKSMQTAHRCTQGESLASMGPQPSLLDLNNRASVYDNLYAEKNYHSDLRHSLSV